MWWVRGMENVLPPDHTTVFPQICQKGFSADGGGRGTLPKITGETLANSREGGGQAPFGCSTLATDAQGAGTRSHRRVPLRFTIEEHMWIARLSGRESVLPRFHPRHHMARNSSHQLVFRAASLPRST